jgi:fluoride exporter
MSGRKKTYDAGIFGVCPHVRGIPRNSSLALVSQMNALSWLSVGLGAAIGAWLRWGLSHWLNAQNPSLPYGTLASNLIGGYLAGIALAWFTHHAELPPEWRLFIFTGFLGGLTTFSTFSVEITTLFLRAQYGMAFLGMTLHLGGSLLMTGLGLLTFRIIR